MQVKTNDLIGLALDWAVAKCEGHNVSVLTKEEQRTRWFEHVDHKDLEKTTRDFDTYIAPTLEPKLVVFGDNDYKRNPTHQEAKMLWGQGIPKFQYSTSWSQGGEIIDKYGIDIRRKDSEFSAKLDHMQKHPQRNVMSYFGQDGPTKLIAAMRTLVASKMGDTIEVPDELMQ